MSLLQAAFTADVVLMKTLPEAETQNKAQTVKVKKQGLVVIAVVYPNLPTVKWNTVSFYCTVSPEPDPVF